METVREQPVNSGAPREQGRAILNASFLVAPGRVVDFQRALILAQSIDRKEISTPAQISVCRGVLLKTREKQTKDRSLNRRVIGHRQRPRIFIRQACWV